MKKLYLLMILLSSFLLNHAQSDWGSVNFDDSTWVNFIFFDTVSNPENIWQIGSPGKANFDEALSLPNAIVTDTINPYPVNDTSTFLIRYITPDPPLGDWEETGCNFVYKIDADLNDDFGRMEFSTDQGETWIDYLTDTLYNYCITFNNSFSFTGSSSQWQYFYLVLNPQSYCFDLQPGDTLWYRFTFISDENYSGKDGWMIDNIQLWDVYEGLEYNKTNSVIKAFPNPAKDYVEFKVQSSELEVGSEIRVKNVMGEKVTRLPVKSERTVWDCRDAKEGIYFYSIQSGEWRLNGKIIVTH